jgi:hypothetical protein
MSEERNIKIEVWVDSYYARFITIWYPEEEKDFALPENDTRAEQEKNLPVMLVTTVMFKGRREVVGNNPIVPSQHPMPAAFLKEQVRGIAYMFSNNIGLFQASSKGQASAFLSRMSVGFNKVKEMRMRVTPPKPTMSLKDLRDSLNGFTDDQLKKIQVASISENPSDVVKRGLDSCIHSVGGEPIPQLITISKIFNVYDVENPYINNSNLPTLEQAKEGLVGMAGNPLADKSLNETKTAIAKNDMELEMLKTIDKMVEAAGAKDIIPELTREQVQEETIKNLQSKLGATL